MKRRGMKLCLGLLLFAPALLFTPTLAAQELAVRGRVLGPDNSPLAAQHVVLHRVDASGGATVAQATTDATGRYELRVTASADTGAVYFVAARYQEELYIGPPFKPAAGSITEQMLQVGVPGTSAEQLMRGEQGGAQPGGRPATSRSWMLLLIPLAGVAAVALYALVPRARISPDRALLIRVAELDERLGSATDAQRTAIREERARLIAQLRSL